MSEINSTPPESHPTIRRRASLAAAAASLGARARSAVGSSELKNDAPSSAFIEQAFRDLGLGTAVNNDWTKKLKAVFQKSQLKDLSGKTTNKPFLRALATELFKKAQEAEAKSLSSSTWS